MEKTDLLVIVAHADDETLGAGGLLQNAKNPMVQLVVSDRIAICRKLYPRVESYDYADQTLDLSPISKLIAQIESTIARERPAVIVTHSGRETNNDHSRVFEAVRVATRRFRGTVLGAEVLSSTFDFQPSVFLPLSTRQLINKLRRYSRYKTEVKPGRSIESLRALAGYRGASVPTEYAEAFTCIKALL